MNYFSNYFILDLLAVIGLALHLKPFVFLCFLKIKNISRFLSGDFINRIMNLNYQIDAYFKLGKLAIGIIMISRNLILFNSLLFLDMIAVI